MTTEVIQEIDKLLEVIAEKQGGINSKKAKALTDKFAKALSVYFKRLARKFPYGAIGPYVSQYGQIKEAAEEAAAIKITGRVVKGASSELELILDTYIAEGVALGSIEAMELASEVVTIPADFGVENPRAMAWGKKHAGELVTKIDETTHKQLANILTRGIHEGKSTQAIAKDVRTGINGWADTYKGRAKVIAQNELNEAMSEAALRNYEELGCEGKEWLTAGGGCEICAENEGDGVIPIKDNFSSGHARPPAHPRCLCTLSPVGSIKK